MNVAATFVATSVALLHAIHAHAQFIDPSRQPSRLRTYTQCTYGGGLAPIAIDRAPNLPMARPVETPSGQRRVSVADGFRVILAFPNTDPFVNLKIELSMPGQYQSDKQTVLDQMQGLAATSVGEVVKLERTTDDEIDIAALNNPNLDSSTPSFYTFFDDKAGLIATAYILNQVPERRAFQDMRQYRELRDAFVKDFARCMREHRR